MSIERPQAPIVEDENLNTGEHAHEAGMTSVAARRAMIFFAAMMIVFSSVFLDVDPRWGQFERAGKPASDDAGGLDPVRSSS